MVHPLKLERIKRGWTQFHVAINAHVPVSRLSYEERGYQALTKEQKKRVTELFKMKTGELFPQVVGGGQNDRT
jgi:transcriptional regulator with XRE-family HTH domain